MFKAIKKLYQVNVLKPKGLFYLLGSFYREGFSMMAILRFSSKLYPRITAIHDDCSKVNYNDFFEDSKKLAAIYEKHFNLKPKNNVALLCKNHIIAVQSLFALSRIGVNVYLLNVEMSNEQVKKNLAQKDFSLIIYDEERFDVIKDLDFMQCIAAYHDSLPSLCHLINSHQEFSKKLKKRSAGKIVLYTGGSTGIFKTATRSPSVRAFIDHFLAVLIGVNVDRYRSVYIATPIYHGFGLSSLIISMLLGGELFMTKKFMVADACKLIKQNQIEIIVLVPLMLKRMLTHDKNALASVKCIISGGAPLDPELAITTLREKGDILFNLYGTSEAGFSIMARPEDLRKNPSTIGRPIKGISVKIVDESGQILGQGCEGMICIKSPLVMDGYKSQWIDTGDSGFFDENGLYYLRGRRDGMIVSGGENVYPEDLERELIRHEWIEHAFVMSIPDDEFGQRLKAYVVFKLNCKLSEDEIIRWLSGRVARYQMPAQIVVADELPLTLTGKIDKKRLV
ncbi:MAG: AMP-binding protein [Ferruginibacter sp.]|nr:AMP-binding protein [Ferruginibacter sp.]